MPLRYCYLALGLHPPVPLTAGSDGVPEGASGSYGHVLGAVVAQWYAAHICLLLQFSIYCASCDTFSFAVQQGHCNQRLPLS